MIPKIGSKKPRRPRPLSIEHNKKKNFIKNDSYKLIGSFNRYVNTPDEVPTVSINIPKSEVNHDCYNKFWEKKASMTIRANQTKECLKII